MHTISVKKIFICEENIDGLVQYCSNSIANALELLQSCAKLSIYRRHNVGHIGLESMCLYLAAFHYIRLCCVIGFLWIRIFHA